jgi:hypothetical protein
MEILLTNCSAFLLLEPACNQIQLARHRATAASINRADPASGNGLPKPFGHSPKKKAKNSQILLSNFGPKFDSLSKTEEIQT